METFFNMSDVDDDFMCEDEEDYGLVSFVGVVIPYFEVMFYKIRRSFLSPPPQFIPTHTGIFGGQ